MTSNIIKRKQIIIYKKKSYYYYKYKYEELQKRLEQIIFKFEKLEKNYNLLKKNIHK